MRKRKLKSYHLAWLATHPDRSEEWLRDKLIEGFDIHHVDGNHSNDEPSNLILIEAVDHMRMHGPRLAAGLAGWRRQLAEKAMARRTNVVTLEPAVDIDEPSVLAYTSRAGRC